MGWGNTQIETCVTLTKNDWSPRHSLALQCPCHQAISLYPPKCQMSPEFSTYSNYDMSINNTVQSQTHDLHHSMPFGQLKLKGCIYQPSPPVGCDISSTGLNSKFSFSYIGYHTKVKEPILAYYLLFVKYRKAGFISSRVLAIREIQTASSKIWTRSRSITTDDNHYDILKDMFSNHRSLIVTEGATILNPGIILLRLIL